MKKYFRKSWFLLAIILVIALFLYFWKINIWQYLSYDEARDYIIIKKILVDGKFTLIGPSFGILDGGYLPPFYYYLLAPSLLFSGFHIWGPDVFSAIIAVFSVVIFFIVSQELFGKFAAFLGSLFFVFNPYLIQAARHTRDPHMLPLFILVFFLSFKRYLIDEKRWFLLLASISLAAAISLHLTAIVFFPLIILLFIKEIKNFKISKIFIISILSFTVFFLPLLIFDFRHNYSMSRAFSRFISQGGNSSFVSLFVHKTERFFIFLVKLPAIFFSGTFQKLLLSLRSMPLSSLERVNIKQVSSFDLLKLVISGFYWLGTILTLIFNFKNDKKNLIKIILLFTFFGFLITFMTPEKSTFLYYFYSLFPFFFLLLSGAIYYLTKKFNLISKILFSFFTILLAVLPLLPGGLKTEVRPEKYFLEACESIADNFPMREKVVIANNFGDPLRWEHNALEYRYFLEAIYKLPLSSWNVTDYQEANVLYLIDEGDLEDPLKLGGMEVEAFAPKKIERSWTAESGQKIYKMTR